MSIIGGPLPKVNETKEKVFIPAEPKEFLSTQQKDYFTKLIKDNPSGDVWQSAIKNIKNQYPNDLGDINAINSEQVESLIYVGLVLSLIHI